MFLWQKQTNRWGNFIISWFDLRETHVLCEMQLNPLHTEHKYFYINVRNWTMYNVTQWGLQEATLVYFIITAVIYE